MERIANLCSLFERCTVFADIGCDHGYMAEYMLKNHLCDLAYITDISEKSLHKAEILLKDHIEAGKCVPIVADGLAGVPKADFVLIAGMGGEEIVKILENGYLPPRFLFQPMKNSEKLRRYLVGQGARMERDFTFSDGRKYYDAIKGTAAGGDSYTELAFRFGRDNLNGRFPHPFLEQAEEELEKTELRLSLAREDGARSALVRRRTELEEAIYEAQRHL